MCYNYGIVSGKFCTAVNCIDGRAQIPVIEYMKNRFGADYVDCITAPGANLVLSSGEAGDILRAVQISVEKHNSAAIAVAGHHDCAANPSPEDKQAVHTKKAVKAVKAAHPRAEVIGLWVDENWEVSEVA